jgi:hypothetical protein
MDWSIGDRVTDGETTGTVTWTVTGVPVTDTWVIVRNDEGVEVLIAANTLQSADGKDRE